MFKHDGTIFLDEVGDVPAAMQAKLLRVLQERCFERVGGTETLEVDVRVIAASNRPLQKMVRQGTLREDLYYRLNVVRIDLPSRHERLEGIPLLATHFAEKYTALGQSHRTIAVEATNQKPVVARTPGCGPGPDGFMVETSPILLRTSGRTATMRLACDRYRSQS